MSRTNPDRFESLALEGGCTTCLAAPGQWCTTGQYGSPSPCASPAFAATLHTGRARHLTAAYWQGYMDGKLAASVGAA